MPVPSGTGGRYDSILTDSPCPVNRCRDAPAYERQALFDRWPRQRDVRHTCYCSATASWPRRPYLLGDRSLVAWHERDVPAGRTIGGRLAGHPVTPNAIPRPTRSRFAFLHPRVYLGLHGIVGLLLASACTWLFFAIADEVPEKAAMVRVDNAVATWLQVHGTETGESIFVGVSYLGAQVLTAVIVAVAILFIVRRDWRHLAVLAITCGGGALLNGALKLVFHRARPTYAVEFQAVSWSFPSGHAMDSLIVYGLFAYWLGARHREYRRLLYLGAAALVAAIGYARLYLGVHFLSDVIAGFSAGLVWLSVCITGYQFAERRRIGAGGEAERRR